MAHVTLAPVGFGDNEATAAIAVIGCGNANRRDDGAGPAVIRTLAARNIGQDARVRLLDAGTDGMAVMFAAAGCSSLIIVDACQSGAATGAIFEVPGAGLEQERKPSLTLHDFRWNHALYTGRQLFGPAFPDRVTIFLIEAATVDFGLDLSPPVTAAAAIAADRIEALLQAHLSKLEPVP